MTKFFVIMIYLNIALGIFNLLPIPPLDGGNIIYSFLPDKIADKYDYYLRKYSNFLNYCIIFLDKILFIYFTKSTKFNSGFIDTKCYFFL